MKVRPLDCNINQQDLSEIGGYLTCLQDLTKFLNGKSGIVTVEQLADTIIATYDTISTVLRQAKESPHYTIEMVDKDNPAKSIAGPDALLLDNTVFERSYTQSIIDDLYNQLGLKP